MKSYNGSHRGTTTCRPWRRSRRDPVHALKKDLTYGNKQENQSWKKKGEHDVITVLAVLVPFTL